jgi:hypothetical protein
MSATIWIAAVVALLVVLIVPMVVLLPKKNANPHQPIDDDHTGHYCGTHSPTDVEKEFMRAVYKTWKHNKENADVDYADIISQSQENMYNIPVYIHVMAQDATTGVVTDDQIASLVTALNDGFQGSAFTYELVEFDVTFNPTWYDCSAGGLDLEKEFKTTLRKGGTNAMNIYLCSMCMEKPCQLGWSTYPESAGSISDGIVIQTLGLPVASDDDIFVTMIHEAGHWLGLLHTFEGYIEGTAPTGGCNPSPAGGDGIAGKNNDSVVLWPTLTWI